MAIPIASIAATPYTVGAPQVIPNVAATRGEHKIYTPMPPALPNTAPRINATWTHDATNANVMIFTGAVNAGGTAYYLPYDTDKITSLRLPDPPPPGVDFFLTANMSGCKFFIDTINLSADLMVYHANARSTSPAPAHSPANFQNPLALAELNRLHAAAQNDYTLPPYNLVLNNVAHLAKLAYYGRGALAEQRKANAHRRPWVPASTPGRTLSVPGPAHPVTGLPTNVNVAPEFWGGCSVFGFYNAGWHFYYQTWGGVEYDRPTGAGPVAKALFTGHWNYLGKLTTEGGHRGVSNLYNKVVDHAQFH
ncbi:MAG TPA: hypothetical protein VGG56_16080 [Terracidiphilus sp.]|jgi:hypothetical protein